MKPTWLLLLALLSGCAARDAHRPAPELAPNLYFYFPRDVSARIHGRPPKPLAEHLWIDRDATRSQLLVRDVLADETESSRLVRDGQMISVTSIEPYRRGGEIHERDRDRVATLPLPDGTRWEYPGDVTHAGVDDTKRFIVTWHPSTHVTIYRVEERAKPVVTFPSVHPPQSFVGVNDRLYVVTGPDHERSADLVGQVQAGPRFVHLCDRVGNAWKLSRTVEVPGCDVLDVDPLSDMVLAQSRTFVGWVPPDAPVFHYQRFLFDLASRKRHELHTVSGNQVGLPTGFFLSRDPLR
jgi:hypothetical protein